MIEHPVQRGVGEDEVEVAIDGAAVGELLDGRLHEVAGAARQLRRRRQHRRGGVDADDLGAAEALGQPARQAAGAAAEIDDAQLRLGLDERCHVVERLLTRRAELVVLLWIPVHQ